MEPFLSFLAVATVAMLVPGPDTFVVLRTALADGPRAGRWAAAGSALGNVLWGFLILSLVLPLWRNYRTGRSS